MKTFKYILKLKARQKTTLNRHFEMLTSLYNWVLQTQIEAYEKNGKKYSRFDVYKLVTKFRQQHPAYQEISTMACGSMADRVEVGFAGFFRRVKAGQKPGFPRFKGRNRIDSFQMSKVNSIKPSKDGYAVTKIKGLGTVEFCMHRPIEGVLRTLSIQKDSDGKFYISFVVDDSLVKKSKPVSDEAVGIDYGISHFLTMSNGQIIDHPKPFERHLKNLKKHASRIDKAGNEQNWKEFQKQKKVKQKIDTKVKNIRKDFHHKTSRKLVQTYGTIVVEDLNLTQMAADGWKHMNRHAADLAYGYFVGMLAYKAEEAGCKLIKVNPAYTSQICSSCGTIVEKTLSNRVHNCFKCGYVEDRDVNAAKNILRLGLQSQASNGQEVARLYCAK